MPYEDGGELNTDEFVYVLALVEDIINNNSDCHVILGGILMLIFVVTGRTLHYLLVSVTMLD